VGLRIDLVKGIRRPAPPSLSCARPVPGAPSAIRWADCVDVVALQQLAPRAYAVEGCMIVVDW